jgi:L-seryl-tRNA(Ser) seleniumtransferase
MVMILSCPAAEKGELSIPNACAIARRQGIPVIVDAAAEELTIPNIHLQHGANMVAYSGGKCLRGPQAAGLLLGQKDLLQTAWVNSAPHHAFGRSLKVGKEEIMGMLAAVEMWVKRDHDAEWRQWQSWLDHISDQAMKVPGVSRQILQPADLSNHAPVLRLSWDQRVGITGTQVEELLWNGNPRIAVAGSSANTLRVMPYMMQPGDDRIAAEAIYRILSNPPRNFSSPIPYAPENVAGVWALELKFLSGSAYHQLTIAQTEGKLTGTHKGETLTGNLTGSVEGNRVQMRSSQKIQGTSLSFQFACTAAGDSMRGTVDLGEYGKAEFTGLRV